MTLRGEEREALGSLCDGVDCDAVQVHRDPADWKRRLVLALSGQRAVALGNHVFLPDGAAGVALLAHELTHCGQYQAWGPPTYYARAIADRVRDVLHLTIGYGPGPYQYVLDGRPFEAYGMEQQGRIVEDCFNGDAGAQSVSPYSPTARRRGSG